MTVSILAVAIDTTSATSRGFMLQYRCMHCTYDTSCTFTIDVMANIQYTAHTQTTLKELFQVANERGSDNPIPQFPSESTLILLLCTNDTTFKA